MKQVLYINANRTAYSTNQIRHTLTVDELIEYLEQFNGNTPVYPKHDGGYTFGGICWDDFEDEWLEVDESTDEEE